MEPKCNGFVPMGQDETLLRSWQKRIMKRDRRIVEVVCRKVTQLRQQRGLTVKELAKRSGLSVRYLSEVENKGANLTLTALQRLAAALEVSPRSLLPVPQRASSEQRAARLDACIDALRQLRNHFWDEQPD